MLLQTYNPAWPNHFNQIATVLKAAAGGHLLAIHHIGSTAVPGLSAKPIIDIDIEYPTGLPLAPIAFALEQIGYYHNGDQGIPGREVFKRSPSDVPHPVLDAIPHHLYACASNNPELKRHLKFRDRLRFDEEARTTYENIKLEIAILAGQKRKAYAEIKEERAREFVESILVD